MRAIRSILNVLAINVMTGTVFLRIPAIFAIFPPPKIVLFAFLWLWQRAAKNWHANKFGRKRGPLFLVMTVRESAGINMKSTYTFLYFPYMQIECDISASACRKMFANQFLW